jgi:hypothetical protein
MKFKEAIRTIRAMETAGITPFLVAGPGVGKSALVHALSNEDKIADEEIRLAYYNPVDIYGWTVVKKDKVCVLPPAVFTRHAGEPCRFFFDELPNGAQATQNAALQLILDYRLGDLKLERDLVKTAGGIVRPRHTIICAGNRTVDDATVNRMGAQLRTRLGYINLESDLESWRNWAYDAGIQSLIINFLAFTARVGVGLNDAGPCGLLYWFDRVQHADGSNPNPRTWEKISRLLDADPGLINSVEACSALIGTAAAQKLIGFARIHDKLPKADEVVRDGKLTIEPPKSPDAKYAFCGALVASALGTEKAVRVKATRNLAAYCTKWWANDAEFAVLTMKDYGRRPEFKEVYKEVIVTPEWAGFTKTFADLMIVA